MTRGLYEIKYQYKTDNDYINGKVFSDLAIINDDVDAIDEVRKTQNKLGEDAMDGSYVKEINRIVSVDDKITDSQLAEEYPYFGVLDHITDRRAIYGVYNVLPNGRRLYGLVIYDYTESVNANTVNCHKVIDIFKKEYPDVYGMIFSSGFPVVAEPIVEVASGSSIGVLDDRYGCYNKENIYNVFQGSGWSHQDDGSHLTI